MNYFLHYALEKFLQIGEKEDDFEYQLKIYLEFITSKVYVWNLFLVQLQTT